MSEKSCGNCVYFKAAIVSNWATSDFVGKCKNPNINTVDTMPQPNILEFGVNSYSELIISHTQATNCKGYILRQQL